MTEYKYDSWGKILSITGSKKDTIGKTNPFRYKSYYYDNETEMYYLRNRYYDPIIKRFINADNFFCRTGITGNFCIIVTCLHIVTIIRLHVQTQMEMHGWLQQPALLLEWLPPLPARWLIERKSFDEVDWLSAAVSGLGTAVGFMGIGGATGKLVVATISGTVTGISEYKESRNLESAILNGGIDFAIECGRQIH